MEKEVPYSQLQHAFEILQELDEMRKSKQCCDFVIKVGEREIHANRDILCANSKYFRAMFSHDTFENQTGVVELEDLDPDCVNVCTDFMYGRKITISQEKWEDLVQCADRLQLVKLLRFIEKLLEDSLVPDTFYDIWRISNTYDCDRLKEACWKFASENFDVVSLLNEFLFLDEKFILSLTASDLNQASQTNRMKAILNWVKFDVENRSGCMLEMLKAVFLDQVPVQYLRFLLERDKVISQSFECYKLLSVAIMDSASISTASSDLTGEEVGSILIFDDISRHLQCFNPQDNTFVQTQALLPSMNGYSFSAISSHNSIFGLFSDNSVFRLKYLDANATWESKKDMPGRHCIEPCAVVDLRYIYVVGLVGSLVAKYDTILDEWTLFRDGKATFGCRCVLLNKKIYCIGGRRNKQYVNNVEVFDVDSSEWSFVTPLPEAKGCCGVAAYFGKIYVVGGQNGNRVLSTVDCYNPSTDDWTSLPSMHRPRTVLPVILVNSKIIAVGNYKQEHQVIQTYDIRENEWEAVAGKMIKPLWCVGVISHPSKRIK